MSGHWAEATSGGQVSTECPERLPGGLPEAQCPRPPLQPFSTRETAEHRGTGVWERTALCSALASVLTTDSDGAAHGFLCEAAPSTEHGRSPPGPCARTPSLALPSPHPERPHPTKGPADFLICSSSTQLCRGPQSHGKDRSTCHSKRQPLPSTAEDTSSRAPVTGEPGQERVLLSPQDTVPRASLGVCLTSGTPSLAAGPEQTHSRDGHTCPGQVRRSPGGED